MWRSKKFILATVLVAVLLAGSIGGVVLANTENGDDSQPDTLFERVTAILVAEDVNITVEQLEDAFSEAQSDMQAEAMESLMCDLQDVAVLVGIGLNALFGWWWADPVAAFALIPFLLREGWEAFHPDDE